MKISDEELEKELAGLKPTQPSMSLKATIEQRLQEEPGTSDNKVIRLWPVLALAAAACLALVLILSSSTPDSVENAVMAQTDSSAIEAGNPFEGLEPYESEQRLIEAIDDGIVMVVDNEPVRRLRYQFIDSVTMIDQSDGSVFTMEIPREETLFVPVSLL